MQKFWQKLFGKRDHGLEPTFEPLWALPLRDCFLAILNVDGGNVTNSDTVLNAHALRTMAAAMGNGLDIRNLAPSAIDPILLPYIAIVPEKGGVVIIEASSTSLTLLTNDGIKKVLRSALDEHCRQIACILTTTTNASDPELNSEADAVGAEPSQAPIQATSASKHGFNHLIQLMLAAHPATIMLMLLAAVLSNVLMLALPLFIMTVYDRVIPHGALETLWALSLGVMIALLVDAGLRFVRSKLTDAATMGTSVSLQNQLFQTLTQSRVVKTPTATSDWTNTFRDIESAAALVPGLIAGALVDMPFVFLALLFVYFMAGPVVWAAVVGIIVFAVWAAANTAVMRKLGALESKSQNARAELLTESVWLSRAIKAANAEDGRIGMFERLLVNLVPTGHKLRLIANMQPQVTMIIVQIVIVFSVIIGVHQIVAGSMSIGALAATTLLVGRVLSPVGQLMMLISRANQLSRPLSRFFGLLDLPMETAGDVTAHRMVGAGRMELNNVTFNFPDSSKPSLNNIKLDIKPGEKIGIIGPSGCGKSTLLQLLIRFYDATSGKYLIDGYDARQYSAKAVRGAIAYMPQEADLLDATVHENIMMANPSASQKQLETALLTSGAAEFLRNHPEGLSCKTGPRGSRLSGGERQSVALARALISPSTVLILDEPTSSMDNTTEARVIQMLQQTCADKTLILSTHRLQALALVDRIIWMDQGRIMADGPRVEVLARLQKSA